MRYGNELAASPLNCLYSACRGLLVDGYDPELVPPPEHHQASRGFFSYENDQELIRAISDVVERVSPNPRGRYLDAQVTLEVARDHHAMGVAHIWLASPG